MSLHKPRILAQSARLAAPGVARAPAFGQLIVVALFFGLTGAAAFGLVAGAQSDPVPARVVGLNLPAPEIAVAGGGNAGYWREDRVRRGDTIGSVLARLGVDDPEALAFLRTDASSRSLYQLRPGKPLTVETDEAGHLLALRFDTPAGARLSVTRNGGHLTADMAPTPTEMRWTMAAGEIRSSLFAAADAVGLPDAVTLQMADVFAGDIDFYHDLRRGDRFTVVYEMRYVDGAPVGAGRIVAAEFENRGRALRAFLWRGDDGSESYYAEDGAPLRKSFLRSPMEFSRVTSGFSGSRFHPILQTWRAHKGVDYAAPVGTPVRATANARVLFAGRQGGYGNVIQLQHQSQFSTVYAHLSKFAPHVKAGARVAQGEVIGYVGQTGWATGPHLHYEFRVGSEQRDPLTVALPMGEPLPAIQRAAFAERIVPAAAQLAFARQFSGARLAFGD